MHVGKRVWVCLHIDINVSEEATMDVGEYMDYIHCYHHTVQICTVIMWFMIMWIPARAKVCGAMWWLQMLWCEC